MLSQVELSLNEPSDTGLSSLLSKYWAAWQNVANAPEDVATRQALAQSAASLANGFNSLSSQLTTVQTQTTQQQSLTMDQVNSIGTQIASLTGSIKAAELAGEQPNDLLDKRDLLVDQLSELGNVSVSTTAGTAGTLGAIDVTIGGTTLVTDTTASTLTLPLASLTSGKLAGMQAVLTAISDPTSGYLTRLNKIAAALASSTNTQHALGTDLNGNPGGRSSPSPPAARPPRSPSIRRSSTTPSLVAASSNGQAGDAGNAIALSDLQRSTLVGSTTIDGAYSQLVTQIGSDSQQSQQSLDNATALVDSLSNRRQSVSGVSLDEEMANLLQYQRGYQASARALTAMDDMINELITRTGRVGL